MFPTYNDIVKCGEEQGIANYPLEARISLERPNYQGKYQIRSLHAQYLGSLMDSTGQQSA